MFERVDLQKKTIYRWLPKAIRKHGDGQGLGNEQRALERGDFVAKEGTVLGHNFITPRMLVVVLTAVRSKTALLYKQLLLQAQGKHNVCICGVGVGSQL